MTLFDSTGEYLLDTGFPLKTKKGTQIPNERRMELEPARLQAIRDGFLSKYSSLQVRSLSATYNCMGMVFANRRTCIDPKHLPLILRDDGYRRTTSEELQPGDVVVYRDGVGNTTHVGIVFKIKVNLEDADRRVTILSQWGRAGEYFHAVNDVNELLGTPSEYWTDRQ